MIDKEHEREIDDDDEILQDIDGYRVILEATLATWSRAQRIGYIAGLAERWLGVYEKFAAEEGWGDVGRLRKAIDAVWAHVQGRTVAPAELSDHRAAVLTNTPDMDDFDAGWPALCACQILDHALEACGKADTEAAGKLALKAASAAYEGACQEESDGDATLESDGDTWRRAAVQEEIAAQFRLFQGVYWLPSATPAMVEAFRSNLRTGRA
jgi:uncharacterized protein YjaG (DUF416 family)